LRFQTREVERKICTFGKSEEPRLRFCQNEPNLSAAVDALAHALAGKEADQEDLMSAAEFAEAQLELLRIRATRTALIAKLEFVETDMQELRRLLALDRYERYAHTKRRRASAKL